MNLLFQVDLKLNLFPLNIFIVTLPLNGILSDQF